jgi:hypothetical protein
MTVTDTDAPTAAGLAVPLLIACGTAAGVAVGVSVPDASVAVYGAVGYGLGTVVAVVGVLCGRMST